MMYLKPPAFVTDIICIVVRGDFRVLSCLCDKPLLGPGFGNLYQNARKYDIEYMLVAGLVWIELPRDEAFDYVIDTLEKINAKVRHADRTLYRIEGKSATTMTGFTFPFEIWLKSLLETNTLIEILAPLDRQFVNSCIREFTKIMIPVQDPVIAEVESIEQIERQVEQYKQNDMINNIKEANEK
jgi:hypothetical protein